MVTGNWALAQLAAAVGGSRVQVVDPVAPGAGPAAPLAPAAAGDVRAAEILLEPTGTDPAVSQPQVAAAAPAARRVDAGPAGAWLVPADLTPVAARLADALRAADPAGAAAYANGARDVAAEMSSLSADLHDSLSDCPRQVIATADSTFVPLAAATGLTDRVVGTAPPTAAAVGAAARVVRAAGVVRVFAEPWVDDALVRAAAASAGAGVATLDTLAAPPAGGYPGGATYQALLEEDLGRLTAALACPSMGQP